MGPNVSLPTDRLREKFLLLIRMDAFLRSVCCASLFRSHITIVVSESPGLAIMQFQIFDAKEGTTGAFDTPRFIESFDMEPLLCTVTTARDLLARSFSHPFAKDRPVKPTNSLSSPSKGARSAVSTISYLSTAGVFHSFAAVQRRNPFPFERPYLFYHHVGFCSAYRALAAGAPLEKVAAQAHLHPSSLSLYYSKPITGTASPIPVLPSSSPLTHFLRARFVAAYQAAPEVSAASANDLR